MVPLHDRYLELCAGAALGTLDLADLVRFEEHLLEGCEHCARELRQYRETVSELAHAAPVDAPTAQLKERILTAVRSQARDSEVRSDDDCAGESDGPIATRPLLEARVSRIQHFGWAAAAVLAVVAFLTWNEARGLRSENAGQREQLESTFNQLSILEAQVRKEELWGSVMTSPTSEIVVLLPTGAGFTNVRARATYDPSTHRAVFVLDNLRPQHDKDYQLWAIVQGSPKSLGLIETVEEGYAILRLSDIAGTEALSAFAVSVEPKGGSPSDSAPSGPVVLSGSLE